MKTRTEGAGQESIFNWASLREVGTDTLDDQGQSVPGKACEIELTSGKTVRVWRSDDGRQYFCHGLTFGGKGAPGGAVSPYTGVSVETILQEHYQPIPEGQAEPGDILVWRGIAPETTPHSAILTEAVLAEGKTYLDYSARLQTKNGLTPEENMSLKQVIDIYGEAYNTYRRR
jgi:hypothetical protein